jgi:hypothetical protein
MTLRVWGEVIAMAPAAADEEAGGPRHALLRAPARPRRGPIACPSWSRLGGGWATSCGKSAWSGTTAALLATVQHLIPRGAGAGPIDEIDACPRRPAALARERDRPWLAYAFARDAA